MMNGCEEMESMKGRRYRVPRKKTRLEKWLIVICVVLMFILAAMAIFITMALYSNLFKVKRESNPEVEHEIIPENELKSDKICNYTICLNEGSQFSAIKEEKKPQSVCNSPICVQEAASIIRKIDFNIPPCKNFYRFACGNYMKEVIPNELGYTRDVISDMEREMNLKIRRVLENLKRTRRSDNELKMKMFYQSCIAMRKKNLSTKEIVENILRHILLEEWLPEQRGNTASMTLEEKLAIIIANGGKNPLFDVEYEGVNTVLIQDSNTILQEEYLLAKEDHNQVLDEYRRLMIEVFTRIGFSNTAAEDKVESVVNFEILLAEITRDRFEDGYSLIELSLLETILPKFNWLPLFRHLYSNLERVGFKAKDVTVILQSPGYLEELIQLLQDTNPTIVESYVMWSFVLQFLHIFDTTLAKHYQALKPFLNQNIIDLATTDWELCILLAKSRFHEPMRHHYAKDVIKDTILKKIEEVDINLKYSFNQLINSGRWQLYNSSKTLKEMEEISLNRLYCNVRASQKSTKIYPHLRLSDDFIANVFQIEKETVSNSVLAGLSAEEDSYDMLSVRPLYEGASYELPLGIFQSSYIAEGLPSYSTYAALGIPLARKILRFLQKFQNSNEIKLTESTNSSAAETNCAETEYLEFLSMMQIDEKVNTSHILNEYIHSNLGLQLAFEAYKIHVNSYGIEDKLPGLDFEPDQLFFISHAGHMCEVWTEETKETYLQSARSPAEFSVNSALRNSEEFSRAFNCPAGSNMNPNTKCLV